MLHTPIPDRVAAPAADEQRLPPAAGILIAMGSSVALWSAIYFGCVFAF
ncbi:hypothetical protein MZO42_04430 [Sphingomonas psychrotolerans]|uniref:EamA family transporter n=1 Tax=Sphingomonas psychrotolerans TaxID=1327635 RepID=A0ABU3N056_9SPHN|nr:hypothetical protein [Sphingomonas psychrotolerans]MDT8757935.1 hypothetical protein [Sphingomonas psychrotolerans]